MQSPDGESARARRVLPSFAPLILSGFLPPHPSTPSVSPAIFIPPLVSWFVNITCHKTSAEFICSAWLPRT